MLLHRKLLAFVAPSGGKYLILYFSKCVAELLFHLPKLAKFFKTCFTTTKETALAPFNLAHPVRAFTFVHVFFNWRRPAAATASSQQQACRVRLCTLSGRATIVSAVSKADALVTGTVCGECSGLVSPPSWDHIIFTQAHNRHLTASEGQRQFGFVGRLENWTDGSWHSLIETYRQRLCSMSS